MVRLITCCLALSILTASAFADTNKGPVATLPKVGDTLGLSGAPEWPQMQWLYEAPSATDAAGKVIVHWFCGSKVKACVDELARIVTLRDAGRTYIIAYIDAASERDAKKLDPIRESEGVGRGTVAYGKGVTTLIKQLGVGPGPASIVVDVDGKVAQISVGGDPTQLDARDAKVNALIGAIKEYTVAYDGPKTVKIGDKFQLTLKIQLASWLNPNKANEFTLTVPKDIKCDATSLKGDQIKIDGHTVTAAVNCSAPKGIYEARGVIRFSYDAPNGKGQGEDGATWKFEVK